MNYDNKSVVIGIVMMMLLVVGVLVAGLSKVKSYNKPNTDAVVKVMVQTDYYTYSYSIPDGHSGWQGTGIFIDDNVILTAGHVVDYASSIRIITQSGEEYNAVSWYLEDNELGDIGLIFVDTNEIEPRAMFDNAILGEDVWAFGNPFSVFPILTKGIISSVNTPDTYLDGKNMLVADCPINPGNSGCPLFDVDGNILGICSWCYNCSQGMTYFVRSEVIKLMLEKHKLLMKIVEVQ